MNKFAIVKKFLEFERVLYYTIFLESDGVEEDLSETDKFLKRFKDETSPYIEELNIIVELIKNIGERGAKKIFFRFEGSAVALPSKPRKIQGVEIIEHSQLRLYCIRVNESIVILCGGDIKTKNKALDCPNVKGHFRLANNISKQLDQFILDRTVDIQFKELVSDMQIEFEI